MLQTRLQQSSGPFTVSDGKGGNATTSLTITIGGVNDTPTAIIGAPITAPEDTESIVVPLRGTDPDSPLRSITVTTLPPTSQGKLFKPDGTPVVPGEPIPVGPDGSAQLVRASAELQRNCGCCSPLLTTRVERRPVRFNRSSLRRSMTGRSHGKRFGEHAQRPARYDQRARQRFRSGRRAAYRRGNADCIQRDSDGQSGRFVDISPQPRIFRYGNVYLYGRGPQRCNEHRYRLLAKESFGGTGPWAVSAQLEALEADARALLARSEGDTLALIATRISATAI